MFRKINLVLIVAAFVLSGVLFGCSNDVVTAGSSNNFAADKAVINVIAEWSGAPVYAIDSGTSLYGLGSKDGPDEELALMLCEVFPENASTIMANYPSWAIVEDAIADCY